MIGRSKLLVSKEIQPKILCTPILKNTYRHPTCNSYAIVKRIAMSKWKATDPVGHTTKKPNTFTDFHFYEPIRENGKIRKVSATKVGKQPLCKFIVDFDNWYFPLRCMLIQGCTSFILFLQAATAFKIPAVKRTRNIKMANVTELEIVMEGLFKIPLGISFDNNRSYDKENQAFKVMNTFGDYDTLIPARYVGLLMTEEGTMSQLHILHCRTTCYSHDKIHPEYSITNNKRAALKPQAIHIGSIIITNAFIAK